MFVRWLKLEVAVSVFAGCLGAGLVDFLLVLLRGHGADVREALSLSLGLYGTLGIGLGALFGWAVAVVLGALPGGAAGLQDDELDRRIATGLLAGLAGAVTLAALAGAGQALLVSKMHSHALAEIATAGWTLIALPVATVVALAFLRGAARLATALPRIGKLGRTVIVLLGFVALGLVAAVTALSRADWRVLDLGPLEAAAIAVVLAVGHSLMWHRDDRALQFLGRGPLNTIRVAVAIAVLLMLLPGSWVSEGSPTLQAIEEQSLGLRAALALARKVTDRDGDGYSARFGGGDCDDHRADTYPGAEEIPGDGIDQNCEGGDATPERPAPATTAEKEAPTTTTRRPGTAWDGNLLFISMDAFRADRLGVAGYKKRHGQSLTPNLDALANRGAYFRRVWSQAPNTPRSFPSVLTSRYPSDIAWAQRTLNYSPILPSNETFFEQLARGGWRPLGIFSHFYFTADRGLNQGFKEWSDDGAGTISESNRDIAAPRIVPRVIARLQKAAASKERFALWTHLFEPHASYMEHPEFPSTLSGIQGLEEKYDYEIAFLDLWIGKVLAALDSTGLASRTAIVVWADHGEAWGEHKRFFHGQDLTEEQLRVPFIVFVPGHKPVVVGQDVALVDLGPTVLDLVGITPPALFRGRSLMPAIDGQTLPPRPLFAELLPASAWPKHEVMMVDEDKKVTHKISEHRWELHDLTTDPREQNDLSHDARQHKLFEQLRAKVTAFEEGHR